MSATLREPMTFEEFLAWEDRQELRYEYDGVHVHAMTGGTILHDDVTFGVRRALDVALKGKPCRHHGPNAMIRTSERKARYPDALITCKPIDGKSKLAPEPVEVFEVISPGSAGTDRIIKLREYKGVPSIQRYVILEQDAVAATVLERRGEDWVAHGLTSGDVLAMPEVGATVAMDDIYDGIELPAQEDDGR